MIEEHRRIAERAGTAWKYAPTGRALRLAYRLTRGAEYLALKRSDLFMLKLKKRFGSPATGG